MESIRIEKVRSLADTGDIKIKPITILVGNNGSGKSTFIRSFPLIKQSVETNTRGPILWNGQYVDFGTFKDTVTNRDERNKIQLSFRFRELDIHRRYYRKSSTTLDIYLQLGIAYDTHKSVTYISSIILKINETDFAHIEISPKQEITKYLVNDEDFSSKKRLVSVESNRLVPRIAAVKEEHNKELVFDELFFTPPGLGTGMSGDIINTITPFFRRDTKRKTIQRFASRLQYDTKEKFLRSLKSSSLGTKTWKLKIQEWNTDNPTFIKLRTQVLARDIFAILETTNTYLDSFAENSSYIAPARATADRYYRQQELAVDTIDSRGANLAMFLRSLPEYEAKDFQRWTDKHFGFQVFAEEYQGHVSLFIQENVARDRFNLADTGFGYSQILPIVAQIWWQTKDSYEGPKGIPFQFLIHTPRIISIEQPELHLHPKFQAKFADLLIYIIKNVPQNDMRFIIETHSDALINTLGHRIAENEIAADDVNIILFNKKSSQEFTEVQTSNFDDNGYLKNWPYGFFNPETE